MKKHLRFIPLIFASLAWLPLIFLGAVVSAAEVPAGELPEGLEKSDWQSIRAAHGAWQHEFREVDGQWQARNPGQHWTTTFDGRGFIAKPDAAAWTWGLQLQSYGFAQNPQTISGPPEITANGQRFSYNWEGGLEEWFVNDQRGLEHGFIVPERPRGASPGEPLAFTLSTLGTLRPKVSKDAQTIHFRDQSAAPVLNYSGLKVWDADGVILSSSFEPATEGEFRIVIDETDARYPITIDPIAQQAFLKAEHIPQSGSDQFGDSVAVSGDTVVVGALREDSSTTGVDSFPDEGASDSGAAYIFVRSGSTWSQQAYLKPSNTSSGNLFGDSVAASGNTVVIGAARQNSGGSFSGAAYVFVRSGSVWSEQAFLKGSNTQGSDQFGWSVAVSGETIVVGAFGEDSGTTGVNSTPNESASASGAAYVFLRTGTAWNEQAYLKASNTGANDEFGWSVAVSGNTAVVGARREASSTTGVNSTHNDDVTASGAAYVFVRDGTTWSEQAYLKASNTGFGDFFGASVAVSGNTVVVGSDSEDSSATGVDGMTDNAVANSGAAYVFERVGITWSQEAFLKASNTGASDFFGRSVAISGNTVVVGAQDEGSSTSGVNSSHDEGASDAGAAYVFVRSGGTWNQQAYLKSSNTGADDNFGTSVAVSGDTVMIGAPFEDGSNTGVNSTPNDDNSNSGAAYIFVRSSTTWSQQAYMKASSLAGADDLFGHSVAVSGDTVVVGATGEDSNTTGVNGNSNEGALDSGAAYVFVRDGGTWSQQAFLKASNTGVMDQFGISVAVSGDTLVVGALNEASSTTGVNGTNDELALNSGAAYVFIRNGTTWSQQAFLKASNTGIDDLFGYSVAVSGDTVVVGSFEEDGSTTGVNGTNDDGLQNSGAAYVFERNGTTWNQQAYLKASNTGTNDQFGISVAVNGDTVLVGSDLEDSNTTGVDGASNDSANNSGAAYVFIRISTTWSQQAFLKASNTGENDLFGISVAVFGDTAVVGAKEEDSSTTGVNGAPNENASYSGAAYIFVRSGPDWNQQAFLKASNTGAGDNFGYSVAVSEDTVVVGAYLEDSNAIGVNGSPNDNARDSGAAYVFVRSSTIWSQQAFLKASNTGASDQFGQSVAVSGDTVVVGAIGEDSSVTGVDGTPDEEALFSGASYISTGFGPDPVNEAPFAVADFEVLDSTAGSVSLDASESSDTDGTIVSYDWSWGDGESATGEITSGTFSYGQTEVELTITDDLGATSTTTITVDIPAPEYEITTNLGEVTITKYNGAGGAVVIPQMLGGNPVTAIGDNSFSGKLAITSIVIPEGVTSIGRLAFSNCSGMTEVTLPDSLISIGSDAFSSCSELLVIILPQNLESIGNFAFFNCIKLTSIDIPESVTTIGSSAFNSCSGLISVVLPAGLERIEISTFRSCSALENILIPANVNFIGVNAFRSCTSMRVALFEGNAPSTVNPIFFDMGSEFNVVFSEGSTGFTTPTWKGYPSSEASPTIITGQPTDQAIFENTDTTLVVSVSSNPAPTSQWFLGNSGDTSSPISGATETTYATPILTTTTSYWVQLTDFFGNFLNSSTATVTVMPEPPQLPDLQVDISAPATATAGQTFDYTITARNTGDLGASNIQLAFFAPSGLTVQSIALQGGFTRVGTEGVILVDGSLAQGESITLTVEVSGGVAGETYQVPPGSLQIDFSEFVAESDETNNGSPQNLSTVVSAPPEFVFINADGEVTITGYNGNGGAVVIPQTLEGNPVTVIGNSSFEDNDTITSVVVPEGVTEIETYAFRNCSSIVSVSLPNSLLRIGLGAFEYNSELTTINFPPNLDSIGNFAFQHCRKLTGIVFPDSVTAIGNNAFRSCSGLLTVILPNTLQTIEFSTFHSCTGLTSITIPTSVTDIANNAFIQCNSLVAAFFQGDAPSMGGSVFIGTANGFAVYFFTGSTGFTTPTWNDYASIELPSASLVAPEIISQPVGTTITSGTSTLLFVAASGNPLPEYQWYIGNSGDLSQPISGEAAPVFTTPNLNATTSYWVRATNTEGTADSNTATVVVETGTNANLASLVIDSGNLSPGFNQLTLSYSATVSNSTSAIRVTPTAVDTEADLKVNGITITSGATSSPIALSEGQNSIEVVVRSADSSVIKTYTLAILRNELPTVTTDPATNATASSVLLRGTVDPNGGTEVYFEYGSTTAYGTTTPPQAVFGNNPISFQAAVSGLPSAATVHYRAVVLNGEFPIFGLNRSTNTLPPALIVVTGNPVVTDTTEATLVGAVNTRGVEVELFFEYGTTIAYGNSTTPQTIPAGSGVQDVFQNVTGLISGANYHVRLVVSAPASFLGNDMEFEVEVVDGSGTGSPTGVPLVITGGTVDVQDDSGTLKGTVNSMGGTTTTYFEYGTTPAYGQITEVQAVGNDTLDAEVSIPAENLLPGTTYYYRILAENSQGSSSPGTQATFTTNFTPPVVTTGEADALTTTSVRVRGTVRARNADTDVEVLFGTNPNSLSDGVATSPALATGNAETKVAAELENLLQSVTYYYQVRAVNSGGTTLGPIRTFRATTLSGILQVFPDELLASSHQGSLQVNLSPSGIGAGWRLAGEQIWRLSGDAVTGLASGDRVVEFRPASGYIQPSGESVTIVSGDPPNILARPYTASGATGSGGLTVNLKPDTTANPANDVDDRAQWRLIGETDFDWKDTGETETGLVPGSHVVECKRVAGRSTPPPASVIISDSVTTSVTLTYYEADTGVGSLPGVLAFDTITTSENLPLAYVGQIRSDVGSSTGFVVRPRVVATVAHAVFDDGTLASATGLQWLFQRHRETHEPTPLIPRGFYTMTGYAAQRIIDNSPGISTPESQHLDAAAMYFTESAGRSGFSGYLASDLDDNEFLLSSKLKTLIGYPVENVSATDLDRMHATTPSNISFTRPPEQTRTFTTQDIRSAGGSSGGPICVLANNGKFYPAAIYLGGTGQTVVRAIDSEVATLFGFAEISGDSASGSGSGNITDSQTTSVGTPNLGSLKVIIEPIGARNAGAGWQIGSGSYLASGGQVDDLEPNSYGIQFATVPGFEAPATPSVDIVAGELKTVTFTYEIIVPPPVINSPAQVTVNKNDSLLYQTTATNSPDIFGLSGLLPLGTVFDPATGRITGILQEAGKFEVVVGVSNLGGTDTKTLVITSLPLISTQSVNAPFEQALTYQIVSSESGEGATFAATNLPPGLALNESTGGISGTPTIPGTYVSPITVTVKGASRSSVLTFEITGTSPTIVSQPVANIAIEYGTNVVLTIEGGGLPAPSVQWYFGMSGDVSQPILGATETTFASLDLTTSTNYWARLTNLSGTVDSNTSAIQILPSTNANLAFLDTGAATLSPAFNSGGTNYSVSIPNSVASMRLTPNTAVPVSTVTIDGAPSPINTKSDPIPISVGVNSVVVSVTAQDGVTTKDYTLTITRAVAPMLVTLGADGINDISATIRGGINPNGSGLVAFDYGPTTSYGSRAGIQQVSGNFTLPVSAVLTSLAGSTTYHYRIEFFDGGTSVFGEDKAFTTGPSRPLVVTGNAVGISETGGTLIGVVNPRGSQTDVHFAFGTDPNVLGTTTAIQDIGSGASVVEVVSSLTGLITGETYYYRTVAESSAFAQPVVGEVKQFTAETTANSGDGLADSPPTVIPGSETATSIDKDGAVLESTVNPNDGSTLIYFEYGKTAAYGFQSDEFRIGNGTQNALVTIPIENLETGATYFFRTVAENAKGVTMGTGSSFSTTFQNPSVTTGQAAAISTRSARVNGVVQPNGTSRDVYFRYGTDGNTFPQSVRAFQQTVDGSTETSVHVDLVNLDEGVTYFYKLVATDVGEAEGTDGDVLSLNASFLVGFLRQEPRDIPLSERQGQLTVNLLPDGTGNWRFRGEQTWRVSGETANVLTAGDRQIEFRPIDGFIQPPVELAGITDGDPPLVLERSYFRSSAIGTGYLQVVLVPTALADVDVLEADRAQWRLAGDADQTWKNSGHTVFDLLAGTYLVECKAINEWDKPVLATATVATDVNTPVTITYFQETIPLATVPGSLTFNTVTSNPDLPYSYVGQVRSNLGSHSGFVVKPRVVATIAQAVFDEATLSTVGGLQWLLQRDSTTHEPKPISPRGTYLFTGYDAQRDTESTPGTLALESQELNIAALYFFEDVGRGGFSGFLASDEASNEFLISSDPKILAGYPVNQGRMHATAPDTSALTLVQGKIFSNSVIGGQGGMTGGPLCVQYEGGAYYPAGIYLGGTNQTLIRAIDGEVVDLFTRAEVSGNGGDNNTGGGITHSSVLGNLNATQAGALKVIIEPASANTLGAAWLLDPEATLRLSGAQRSGLSPGSYDLDFLPVDGFFLPTTQSVEVTGGQLTTVTFTYAEGASPIDSWRYENFETYESIGDAADDQDPDQDGRINIDEFTAGTDPNSGNDFLTISEATISGTTYTATLAGKAGRTYKLQRNTTLTGMWDTVDTRINLASDEPVTLTDTSAPTDSAYYRIEVSLP